jgi:hypothetical protein
VIQRFNSTHTVGENTGKSHFFHYIFESEEAVARKTIRRPGHLTIILATPPSSIENQVSSIGPP